MTNKSTDTSSNSPPTEEFKDQNTKYSLSKFEYDLYHEEDDITLPVVRVKRIAMPNNGDKWKVFSDNKVVFTIESNKISKKEVAFLQTVDGFNFILSQAKTGIKSLNAFKKELKNIMTNKPAKQKRGRKKSK